MLTCSHVHICEDNNLAIEASGAGDGDVGGVDAGGGLEAVSVAHEGVVEAGDGGEDGGGEHLGGNSQHHHHQHRRHSQRTSW